VENEIAEGGIFVVGIVSLVDVIGTTVETSLVGGMDVGGIFVGAGIGVGEGKNIAGSGEPGQSKSVTTRQQVNNAVNPPKT